jgi:hypothetical protein
VTLVELLVSIALGAIVLTGLAQVLFYSGRSFAAISNYSDLDYNSDYTLKVMSREIRRAMSVKAASETSITLVDSDNIDLQYVWDSTAKTVSRIKNGVTEVLLKDCEYILFTLWQRNPVFGTFDQYPRTLTASKAKLIQVTWICRRRVMGTQVNTLSELSAKFVLRNQ